MLSKEDASVGRIQSSTAALAESNCYLRERSDSNEGVKHGSDSNSEADILASWGDDILLLEGGSAGKSPGLLEEC